MQQGRRPSSAGSQKQQSAGTMNYSRVAAAASSSSSSPAARPADENSGTSSVAAETLLQEGFEQIVRRMQHLSHLPAKERPQIHSASASSNSPAARSPQKPKSVVSTGWGKPGLLMSNGKPFLRELESQWHQLHNQQQRPPTSG